MNFLDLTIINPSNYSLFSIFYQAAFLLPFIILISLGIRRKYKMESWLSIMLSSAFFFLLGSRIITFNPAEWSLLYTDGIWPESFHKFAVGGILFALAGTELTRRFLKFDKPVLQIYAWLTPLGLAIQKVGCLFSGCCFGTQTSLPWGIKYGPGSIPYFDQLSAGLINSEASASLSIHPTQIYQLLAYLFISLAVLTFSKKFKRSESTIVLSLLLLFLTRFFIEFYIDPQATNFGAGFFMGLKLIQWLCLTLTLLSSWTLFMYEKGHIKSWTIRKVQPQLWRPIVVIAFIGASFILVHGAFTSKELVAFNLRFIILSLLFTIVLFKRISVRKFRWVTPLVLLFPLLLVSQTEPKDWSEFDSHTRLSFGSTFGHYFSEVLYNPHEGSCGTSYYEVPYENKGFALSGQYARTGRKGYQSYNIGGDIVGGYINERNFDDNSTLKQPLILVNPYFEYNMHWLGLGANFNLGLIPVMRAFPSSSTKEPHNSHFLTPIWPGFMARIGPYDIFDIQIDFNNGFPYQIPGNTFEFSLGSGFGLKDGSGIRLGTIAPLRESFFFEGDFLLKDKFGIYFKYTNWTQYYYPEENEKSNIFSVGFTYKLN